MGGRVKVYRYEDHEGRGPYTSRAVLRGEVSWKLEFGLAEHGMSPAHPSPQRDGIPIERLPWYWKCGFLYVSDLTAWFDGLHELLSDAGFSVVAYEVDEDAVWLGSRQVVFLPA